MFALGKLKKVFDTRSEVKKTDATRRSQSATPFDFQESAAFEVAEDILDTTLTKGRRLGKSLSQFLRSSPRSPSAPLFSARPNTTRSRDEAKQGTAGPSVPGDDWYRSRYGIARPASRCRFTGASLSSSESTTLSRVRSDSSSQKNSSRSRNKGNSRVSGSSKIELKDESKRMSSFGSKTGFSLGFAIDFRALEGILSVHATFQDKRGSRGTRSGDAQFHLIVSLEDKAAGNRLGPEKVAIFRNSDPSKGKAVEFHGQQLYYVKGKLLKVEVYEDNGWWKRPHLVDALHIRLSTCDFSDTDIMWTTLEL